MAQLSYHGFEVDLSVADAKVLIVCTVIVRNMHMHHSVAEGMDEPKHPPAALVTDGGVPHIKNQLKPSKRIKNGFEILWFHKQRHPGQHVFDSHG